MRFRNICPGKPRFARHHNRAICTRWCNAMPGDEREPGNRVSRRLSRRTPGPFHMMVATRAIHHARKVTRHRDSYSCPERPLAKRPSAGFAEAAPAGKTGNRFPRVRDPVAKQLSGFFESPDGQMARIVDVLAVEHDFPGRPFDDPVGRLDRRWRTPPISKKLNFPGTSAAIRASLQCVHRRSRTVQGPDVGVMRFRC